MYKTSARLGLPGSIILLLLSLFMVCSWLVSLSSSAALVNAAYGDINTSLFLGLAGLITSALGIAGVKLLSARPVLSRVLLAVAAFISLILAVLMTFTLGLAPDGAMIFVYLLFFPPAALLTSSLIVSLSEGKAESIDFI